MTDDPNARPTGTLITDILHRLSSLLRGEVALAKAEVEASFRAAWLGIGLLVAAVVLALTALNVLSAALVAALVELNMSPGWAALAVGGAFALVALLFAWRGANALKPSNLAPRRTVRNVRRDAETIKEIVTNGTSV
ncbi:MAG: phage holin family protein [Paracoccaceae bacterium]